MLSAREIEALCQLPHLARLLYLQCLRPRMDSQCRVGFNPDKRVSWYLLAKELTLDSGTGVKHQIVTVSQVRRSSDQLERHGMVRRFSSKTRLIFIILLSENGTIVTSERQLSRRLITLVSRLENLLGRSVPRGKQCSKCAVDQEVEQAVDHPPDIDIYKYKNTICECVFDPEGARQIFSNWAQENDFSVTEVNKHIDGYFDFCERRKAKPNELGLQNLLESKKFYRDQRLLNHRTASVVLEAKRQKLRAIAIREEDIADRIHSSNIANRNPK